MAAVRSEYGERELFGRNFHHGVDYKAPVGSPVYAQKPMTVTYTGKMNGYGNIVIAKDSDGYEYRFGHLDSIPVKVGQNVGVGEKIAVTGNTGESTGPHLHYEVRKPDGTSVNPAFAYDANASFSKTPGSTLVTSTPNPNADSTLALTSKSSPMPSKNYPAVPGNKPSQNMPQAAQRPPSGLAKQEPTQPSSVDKSKLVARRRINPLLKLGDD